MKKLIQPSRTEIVCAVNESTEPFDAIAISKSSGRSVLDCMKVLVALAGTGFVIALNESPQGEPHHISERYMRAKLAP